MPLSVRRMAMACAAAVLATAITATDLLSQRHQQRRSSPPAVGASAELGIRGGRDFDAEAWLVGTQLRMPIGPWGRIQLMPSADLILLEDNTAWQVNIDANFELLPEGTLYAGGGYAILAAETIDEAAEPGLERTNGWNLHVGVKPPMHTARIRPYVEARWTLVEDTSVFRLMFGLNTPLGR